MVAGLMQKALLHASPPLSEEDAEESHITQYTSVRRLMEYTSIRRLMEYTSIRRFIECTGRRRLTSAWSVAGLMQKALLHASPPLSDADAEERWAPMRR